MWDEGGEEASLDRERATGIEPGGQRQRRCFEPLQIPEIAGQRHLPVYRLEVADEDRRALPEARRQLREGSGQIETEDARRQTAGTWGPVFAGRHVPVWE